MTVPYTFANRTGNIPLSELDANFSNVGVFANTAGTVTTAAQPNITLVGTLSSLTVSGAGSMASLAVSGAGSMANLTVSGNVTAGNIIGTVIGNISNAVSAITAGTVTTNAQPNITSVGTLTTLTVTGNVIGGNVSTAGELTVTGNITSGNLNTTGSIFSVGNISGGNVITVGNVNGGNLESTGLVRGVTVQATGNLVGGNANISTSVNTLLVNAANVVAANISATRITAIGNVTGNYFIGNGSQLTGTYGNSNVAAYLPNYTGNISAGNIAVAQDMTVVGSLTAGTIQGTFVGNISGNLVVPGSNTWVIYNNAGSAGAESSFRYDSAIDTVIVTGTANIVTINSTDITATGNISGNLTTAVQPNITSVGTLGNLSVTGNITGGNISGAGAGLSALTGANVTGTVANATSATTAGTVTTAAQPNITSVGTLTSITSSGNIAGANVDATGNVTGVYILGNASGLISLTGANVTGTVANATYSITADTVANATQSNITSVGTLVSLLSSGNITGANLNAIGNVTGGNVISTDFMKALTIQATGNLTGGNANIINSVNAVNGNFTNVAATITTATQPYITSLGTLANLSVTGNISSSGNISGNYFVGNGSQLTGLGGPVFMATQTSYQNLASSPSSISTLELIYDNVTLNISNGYSSTTGIFTAPTSGVYQVNGSIGVNPFANTNAGGGGALIMYYNGNTYASGPIVAEAISTYPASNTYVSVVSQSSLSTLVYLNTSDTVQLKLGYYTNAASNVWTTETNLVPSSFQAAWIRS